MKVYVLPNVGKNNGVATHLETVIKFSKHQVVNGPGTDGIINTQACGVDTNNIDVYTAHSYYADADLKSKWCQSANVRLIHNAKIAKRVICVSEYVKNFLVKNGVNEKKMTVIENPLDLEYIDSITPASNAPYTLFIGDKEVKRPGLFLELAKRCPNDNFIAIGLTDVKDIPPNVVRLHPMPREQTLRYMKGCSIFLLLSKRESCPYALLEAMAMGKTCVVANFAGQREIIEPYYNGYTFDPDNIINLTKVFNLAKQTPLGDKARYIIERKFDARIQVPKIDSVYSPPKISIFTYVFCSKENNRLPLLMECIKSISDQKYPSYEHVIVDDGSTIPLHQEILKLNDPNIRYCWKTNTGIIKSTKTFNHALTRMQGEFIMLLSSDDVHMPGTLVELSCYLISHPTISGVVCNYVHQRLTPDGKVTSERVVIRTEKEPISKVLLKTNCVNGCAIMFRKSCLDKIELPPDQTGFAADYDLWVRLSEVAEIHRYNKIFLKYRDFGNTTRKITQQDMFYRKKCTDYVIFHALKRRRK